MVTDARTTERGRRLNGRVVRPPNEAYSVDMKKYCWVPVPFLICTSLALFFAFSDPKPDAAYGRDWIYDYLSGSWLGIGIVLSALTLIILLIYDIFEFWGRASRKRSLRR